jgi:serpin B
MKKTLILLLALIGPLLGDVPLNGISEFGWDLFQSSSKSGKNTVFSPYSIYSCMAMTSAGAQGDTLKEMQKVFYLPSSLGTASDALAAFQDKVQGQVKVANALWIAPQFFVLADFRKTIEDDFHASATSLDFGNSSKAAETINRWTADHTDQKITNLIAPGDLRATTRLVLTNALYFSGKFLKPFNSKLTQPQDFWTDGDTSVQTDAMQQTAIFSYSEDDVFQIVALPFEKSSIALALFLPKEKTFTGLSALLDAKTMAAALDSLGLMRVHVQLPKFTLKERLNLNQLLSQLGLSNAFSPQADFAGINGKQDLSLSNVLHAAMIAVDENGVVAAAATAASIGLKSVHEPAAPVDFIADHPFLFALVDLESGIPLFLGELANPQ